MKRIKRSCAWALVLCLALAACPALAAKGPQARLGQDMPDFTVTLVDGRAFTLSQALKEKDMVLINIWATWCGYCVLEFPYMQEVYEQYGDRAEIIALSVEPTDTPQVLRQFAEKQGITFPVGSDSKTNLGGYFSVSGYPTSIAVDRFGKVAFVQVGAFQSAGDIRRLFAALTDSRYTESRVFYELPEAEISVSPADSKALSEALNAPGGQIVFHHPADEQAYPMLPVKKDGRLAVTSSNAGQDGTYAKVIFSVDAREGDVLAFDYSVSTEPVWDFLSVWVDGIRVKTFSGSYDWSAWAYPLAEGSHALAFSYDKDSGSRQGEDAVWVDDVRLVSGEEAEKLLAALPSYPVAEAVSFLVTTPGAREIVFNDPDGVAAAYLGGTAYWLVPGDGAEVLMTATSDYDPQGAFLFSNYDGRIEALCEAASGGGYVFSTGLNSLDSTGYVNTTVALYPSVWEETRHFINLFSSEDDLNLCVQYLKEASPGAELSWAFADEGPKTYRVLFRDQDGAPVPGCMVNFCTDSACTMAISDASGAAVFTGEPFIYHIQVIKTPAGYVTDGTDFYSSLSGGDITVLLTKE